jgi:hypothetical protein
MSMHEPHTPTGPVTVAELLLALASYPQDAEVTIADPFVDLGVMVGDEYYTVYQLHNRAQHYEPPEVVQAPAPRGHPGDEYATAREVLEWARRENILPLAEVDDDTLGVMARGFVDRGRGA